MGEGERDSHSCPRQAPGGKKKEASSWLHSDFKGSSHAIEKVRLEKGCHRGAGRTLQKGTEEDHRREGRGRVRGLANKKGRSYLRMKRPFSGKKTKERRKSISLHKESGMNYQIYLAKTSKDLLPLRKRKN